MIRSLFILLFTLSVTAGNAQKNVYLFTSFHEPATDGLRFLYSYDGYKWTALHNTFLQPAVGSKVMRDPSMLQGPDGTFHLVWTSGWNRDRGFGYASSTDLIHWSPQQFIPVMSDTNTVNVWAPELFYDDVEKQFIIVWASTIPYKFPRDQEEERNNHRLYYTTTKDFKTFSPAALFLDPGFSVIDAVIVKRGKEDYVLLLKDNTRPNRNIKVAFGKTPLGPYTNISAPFTGMYTEGPSVVHAGNNWLIYYDAYQAKRYGAVKTKDFKHFDSSASNEISVPEGHKHGTIVSVPEKILTGLKAIPDTIRYTGRTLSNVDYHHGQLSPAVGVHNIQVMRANREHPEQGDGFGWTYNHAPMLAYWNNTFYLEYLSNTFGEHVPPGQTVLATSKDGYRWTKPALLFPPYKIPDGTKKDGHTGVAYHVEAVMHQRMGFHVTKSNRLLALAYYGMVLEARDDPNDGNGIGRVVREIYKDGSFGPIYFIRYNHAFSAANTSYPFFESSKDKDFVQACKDMLANPLLTQQWNEEADRNDPLITLKNENYKAFNYYHLPDNRVVGLWKYALTDISIDEGKTWQYNPVRAPGFVNSNAKIWGQRTKDGKYLTVYNPSEFRWPLALSVSDDGLNYKNLLLVNGEITSLRYGGAYKSYGPQYVRGIQEGDGIPPGNNCWVSYSMNKEDIWVSKIPLPVTDRVDGDINEEPIALDQWNVYSPLWAPVAMEAQALALRDRDPFDYAKAERVIPVAKKMTAEFTVTPLQNDHGLLDIEFLDAKGTAGIRLSFDSAGNFRAKAGYRYRNIMKYEPDVAYTVRVELNTANRLFIVTVNGKNLGNNLFFAPLESIQRIAFRTGDVRRFPDADTPTDQMYDLPNGGGSVKEAGYLIRSLKTKKLD